MNVPVGPTGVGVGGSAESPRGPVVVVQQAPPRRRWRQGLLLLALIVSIGFNLELYSAYRQYLGTSDGVVERHYSGETSAADKIALISVEGTITPPFTGRILKAIEHAKKGEHVKGVVLVVDSPGGLVADSHEIYHQLRQLQTDRKIPVYVSMKRLAASGGYYVSMGAGPDGRIFAEPTTWTGSIGVILPHYDASKLASNVGVSEDSLKTGPYKDTLSFFRPVSETDKKLWMPILDETLDRFIEVIVGSRKGLDAKQVRELATGQVFTARQAKDKKLVDEIGFLDDAIAALKSKYQLANARVVRYEAPPGLLETLVSSSESARPESRFKSLLEGAVPRSYYLFTSLPGIAAP